MNWAERFELLDKKGQFFITKDGRRMVKAIPFSKEMSDYSIEIPTKYDSIGYPISTETLSFWTDWDKNHHPLYGDNTVLYRVVGEGESSELCIGPAISFYNDYWLLSTVCETGVFYIVLYVDDESLNMWEKFTNTQYVYDYIHHMPPSFVLIKIIKGAL